MRHYNPLLQAALLATAVKGLTIAEINGDAFVSPYKGELVTDVTGLVIAKGSSGIWIRSTTPDDNPLTSEAIYVYSSSVGGDLSVGDIITLDGTAYEYRSSSDYLYLGEISSPKNVVVVSSGNDVVPLVIGEDTSDPPNEQFSALDGGDVFGLPNNQSLVTVVNPTLEPELYGMDFWESLSGELVTLKAPRAVQRPNSYGDTWVVAGGWNTSGENAQGGLTMTPFDANPEGILIGSPLDSTSNPSTTKMGDQVSDITGILTYAFGFYRILPLTALSISTPSASASGVGQTTTLQSTGDCRGITVADYNVENLMPDSAHLPLVADQIVNNLRTPDLLCIQEVQDNSGATNDGIVAANVTLANLVGAISAISNVTYDFVSVDTQDGTDGGQPGGNIRVAFLYKPAVLKLAGSELGVGGATDANKVSAAGLKYNPGRIDPENDVWSNSRKPIVAAWEPVRGNGTFYTVNVHWGSKGGSTSLHGDARPPVNGGVVKRAGMAEVTGSFINELLALDPQAHIIASGDFNEFSFVGPMTILKEMTRMKDLDEVMDVPMTERYTYIYDMNAQALDHMLVSESLQGAGGRDRRGGAWRKAGKVLGYEHLHVSTWVQEGDVVSDHDPSVALLNLCEC